MIPHTLTSTEHSILTVFHPGYPPLIVSEPTLIDQALALCTENAPYTDFTTLLRPDIEVERRLKGSPLLRQDDIRTLVGRTSYQHLNQWLVLFDRCAGIEHQLSYSALRNCMDDLYEADFKVIDGSYYLQGYLPTQTILNNLCFHQGIDGVPLMGDTAIHAHKDGILVENHRHILTEPIRDDVLDPPLAVLVPLAYLQETHQDRFYAKYYLLTPYDTFDEVGDLADARMQEHRNVLDNIEVIPTDTYLSSISDEAQINGPTVSRDYTLVWTDPDTFEWQEKTLTLTTFYCGANLPVSAPHHWNSPTIFNRFFQKPQELMQHLGLKYRKDLVKALASLKPAQHFAFYVLSQYLSEDELVMSVRQGFNQLNPADLPYLGVLSHRDLLMLLRRLSVEKPKTPLELSQVTSLTARQIQELHDTKHRTIDELARHLRHLVAQGRGRLGTISDYERWLSLHGSQWLEALEVEYGYIDTDEAFIYRRYLRNLSPLGARVQWAQALSEYPTENGIRYELAIAPTQLVSWGQSLRSCLGHGTYHHLLADTSSRVIVGIFENNGLVATADVEIKDFSIRQLRGLNNKDMPEYRDGCRKALETSLTNTFAVDTQRCHELIDTIFSEYDFGAMDAVE